MSLATAIRRQRRVRGLTQKGLAQKIGLKRPTIASYETGAINPSLEVLRRLATALHCSIASLLGDDEPYAASPRGRPYAENDTVVETLSGNHEPAEEVTP